MTELRGLEVRLREASEQWQSLARHAPGTIIELDSHGRIAFASQPTIGDGAPVIRGGDIYNQFPESAHDKIRECLREAFNDKGPSNCVVQGFGKSWFSLRFGPVHILHLKTKEVFSVTTLIVTDISDERSLDAEFKSVSDQLRQLSAKLESVREEERTRIARELHDEFGQALTAMRMELSWVKKRMPSTDGLNHKIETVIQSTDAMIDNLRRIVADLRPPILDDLGLVPALEWQIQDFQKRSGIQCTFRPDQRPFSLDGERATAVFRVVQEALTNVARHASAKNIGVELKIQKGQLVVNIRDDGKGIPVAKVKDPASLGLLGMRERLARFGGELEIYGRPSRGTRIRFQIPID